MATFTTTGGVDIFNGGSSNDLFLASLSPRGGSVFNGKGGTDTLRFLASAMISPEVLGTPIPLALGVNATISNIEKLHLASQAGQNFNVLFNYAQIKGFSILAGGAGTDSIIATVPTGGGTFSLKSWTLKNWGTNDSVALVVGQAAGNYTLNASAHSAGFQFLGGGAGNDTLNGTNGREELNGNGGTNTINALGGDDRIFTGRGIDTIDAGDGNDQVDVEGTVLTGSNYNGGAGIDTLQINLEAQSSTPNGLMFLGTDLAFSGFERLDFDSAPGERLTAIFRLSQMSEITTLMGGDGDRTIVMLLPSGGGKYTVKSFTYLSWGQSDIVGIVVGEASGNYTLNASAHATGLQLLGGGAGDDKLTGTDGAEILNGGAGRDLINAKGGFNIIDGGAGTDTLTYINAGTGVTVKLGLASEQNTGAGGLDKISNIENVIGSAFNDNLVGTMGGNIIKGGTGADKLTGGKGKDLLYGGADSDRDTFVFQLVSDTKVGTGRDRIYDFVSGTDKINLAQIDANKGLASDQAFAFSTSGAAANAIWITDTGPDLIVHGDVNGDALADFQIQLMGVASVTAADFIL